MMADIAFDEPTATTLQDVFSEGAAMLQRAGWERFTAIEAACAQFRGGYATRFTDACAIESDDRGKLSGKLDDLAEGVDKAIAAAAKERERIAAHEAWEARAEAAEVLRRHTLGLSGESQAETFVGPEPETTAVRPPKIAAAFAPQGRGRYSSDAGAGGGTTSADPVALRGFVERSQTVTALMRETLSTLQTAVSSYAGACSWAPTVVASLLAGFSRFIDENVTDERWVASIAEAFELAGSGTLSDFNIMLAISAGYPSVLERALFDSEMSPAEVAQIWALLAATKGFNLEEFVERYSFELASLNGIPFAVMDQAGRQALTWALDEKQPENLAAAYKRLGFAPGERSLEDFEKDLLAIQQGLTRAEELFHGSSEDAVVQLVSFGRHEGGVSAGISMGNLDTATNVGLLASGMDSVVQGISDPLRGFNEVIDGRPGHAMVTWMGYQSPGVTTEWLQGRADQGALRLAGFLDGIAAQRANSPIDRLVVMGHSYGTNVAAEALKITKVKVHAYVAVGSAGLKPGTVAADLGVDEIYATIAKKDPVAGIGQATGAREFNLADEVGGIRFWGRVDPARLEDAVPFSSDADGGGSAVTKHDIGTFKEGDASDEIGYFHPDASTIVGLREILGGEVAQ